MATGQKAAVKANRNRLDSWGSLHLQAHTTLEVVSSHTFLRVALYGVPASEHHLELDLGVTGVIPGPQSHRKGGQLRTRVRLHRVAYQAA